MPTPKEPLQSDIIPLLDQFQCPELTLDGRSYRSIAIGGHIGCPGFVFRVDNCPKSIRASFLSSLSTISGECFWGAPVIDAKTLPIPCPSLPPVRTESGAEKAG
jgi:hypothetical protein